MKRYEFRDLGSDGPEHIASKLVAGERIGRGALSFHPPGHRTHPEGEHRHEGYEIFCIAQGQGLIEINGVTQPTHAGDVLVIEPGEDHHIIGDPAHPIVNFWFEPNDQGHADQYPQEQ